MNCALRGAGAEWIPLSFCGCAVLFQVLDAHFIRIREQWLTKRRELQSVLITTTNFVFGSGTICETEKFEAVLLICFRASCSFCAVGWF